MTAILLALISVIPTLVQVAQQLWPSGGGKGQLKKDTVTTAATALVNAYTSTVATGGAKVSAETYAPIINALIENAVAALPNNIVADPVKNGG